jgi:hypothetical protein
MIALPDWAHVEDTFNVTGVAVDAPDTVMLTADDPYALIVEGVAATPVNVTLVALTENAALDVKVPAAVSALAVTYAAPLFAPFAGVRVVAAWPFPTVNAEPTDKAPIEEDAPDKANVTSALAIGRPAASLTTAVTVAGCEALTVEFDNDRTRDPAVLLVTVPEFDPVVPPDPDPEPEPKGEVPAPPLPPQAVKATATTQRPNQRFRFILFLLIQE